MATRPLNTIIQHLRRAALADAKAGMTDGELLEAFVARKDDETFAALLRRHGPMVMGVCFRVLRNHHDSELRGSGAIEVAGGVFRFDGYRWTRSVDIGSGCASAIRVRNACLQFQWRRRRIAVRRFGAYLC